MPLVIKANYYLKLAVLRKAGKIFEMGLWQNLHLQVA